MTDPRMTPTNDAPVTVEQCDRERAWPFRGDCYKHSDFAAWMEGAYDGHRAILAFARHRLAALASAPAKQEHDRYANDEAAKALYDSWSNQSGWVPWVARGNSTMQDKARREVAR